MEIKTFLKLGLEDCGFGRTLGMCGSGCKRCLNYLAWRCLFKGKLVHFHMTVAIITLSWVCTCFLIPGSFTVLLYWFAFLLYSGAHQLAPLAREFKGVVSWSWQRQYICACCLYTLKSRDRSEIFIYKHYTNMYVYMYMLNWVLFLLVEMQSTPPVTSDL